MSCSTAGIVVHVDECVYNGDNVEVGFENNENCLAHNENGTYTLNSKLDECGFNAFSTENSIIFKNSFDVFKLNTNRAIYKTTNLDINIECEFSSQVENISTNVDIQNQDQFVSGTKVESQFTFSMEYYSDPTFSAPLDRQLTKFVGEEMYFGIETTSDQISGIDYYLSECTVSDDTNSYDIISNGCIRSPNYSNVNFYLTPNSLFETNIGVSYRSFQFSADAGDTEMEMTCKVRACLEDECPSDC